MLANYFFCELKNIHEIEDDINRLKNVCKFQNKNHECQKYSESITCSWIKIDLKLKISHEFKKNDGFPNCSWI